MHIAKDKPFIFIIGLLYPGFLGAFIIGFADNFSTITLIQAFLLVALALHYIGDYLYTSDEDCRAIYNLPRMFIDTALITIIYISFKVALNPHEVTGYDTIWKCMVCFKGLCFFWELSGKKDRDYKVALTVDGSFTFIYLIGTFVFSGKVIPLIVVLFIDASLYFFWSKFVKMPE